MLCAAPCRPVAAVWSKPSPSCHHQPGTRLPPRGVESSPRRRAARTSHSRRQVTTLRSTLHVLLPVPGSGCGCANPNLSCLPPRPVTIAVDLATGSVNGEFFNSCSGIPVIVTAPPLPSRPHRPHARGRCLAASPGPQHPGHAAAAASGGWGSGGRG